jgi:hypothetical protein
MEAAFSMVDLDATSVAERLDLGEEYTRWLEDLEAHGPPPKHARIPESAELHALLERLGVVAEDAIAIIDGLPRVAGDPALAWLLQRCSHQLTRDTGSFDAAGGEWLDLPESLGTAGSYFYAYVFLSAVGDVRKWHRDHGTPDDVSWATLADLGRQMARHRRMFGSGGLDTQWWLVRHWRGVLYELGRLQFGPYRIDSGSDRSEVWYEESVAAGMGPGFRRGDLALGVHIPEAGPLDPTACDRSFARVRNFFRRRWPDEPWRIATCVSWLLDDQLEEYLSEDSNLVRFQRRFTLVPGAEVNDAEIFKFVFKRETATTAIPQRTTLERAVVAHLRAGRHWRVRTGWLEL